MKIVVAIKEHLPIIQQLSHRIWPVSYKDVISEGQIDYMLNMMYSLESLEEQLQNNKIFILAEEDNSFIGFASYEVNFDGLQKTKIHKLYVLPQTQGKGVGKQLVDYITDIASENQNTFLQLAVNKNNKAKDFYLKIGFQIAHEAVFDIGNGYVMDDYVMEKKL
jgi:ribosomal protein S18 acetylase RimI-like enzyme